MWTKEDLAAMEPGTLSQLAFEATVAGDPQAREITDAAAAAYAASCEEEEEARDAA